VLNAPRSIGVLIGALIAAHAIRLALGLSAGALALTSDDLPQGRLGGLLTYQFVHGGWVHLLMNSAFILAFGAPVARFLGSGIRGALALYAFFLGCGAAAAVAYAGMADLLSNGPPAWALVGASGAASGLMGAAARLMQGQGRLGPITGRLVTGMTFAWVAMNAVLGISGLTPGAGDMPVAWQAHIYGYVAGLLLIGPVGRLTGSNDHHENAF
jgi:membrane associated rhomboid family serine protease